MGCLAPGGEAKRRAQLAWGRRHPAAGLRPRCGPLGPRRSGARRDADVRATRSGAHPGAARPSPFTGRDAARRVRQARGAARTGTRAPRRNRVRAASSSARASAPASELRSPLRWVRSGAAQGVSGTGDPAPGGPAGRGCGARSSPPPRPAARSACTRPSPGRPASARSAGRTNSSKVTKRAGRVSRQAEDRRAAPGPEGEGLARLHRHPPEGEPRPGARPGRPAPGRGRLPRSPPTVTSTSAPRALRSARARLPGRSPAGASRSGSPPASRTAAARAGPFDSRMAPGAERPARGDQLVAGGQDGDPGPPVDRSRCVAQGRAEPDGRRVHQRAGREGDGAAGQVGAPGPDELGRPAPPGRRSPTRPRRRTSSCISTASAPGGRTAPVKIRQQLPGGRGRGGGCPAKTSKAIGRRAPGEAASAARSA